MLSMVALSCGSPIKSSKRGNLAFCPIVFQVLLAISSTISLLLLLLFHPVSNVRSQLWTEDQ